MKKRPQNIPLHFVLMQMGYKPMNMNEREVLRSRWIPLKNEDLNEKIMVAIKFDEKLQEPYYLYYNMNGDEKDRGNIINFCKMRKININHFLAQHSKADFTDLDVEYLKKMQIPKSSKKLKEEFDELNNVDLCNGFLENRQIHQNLIKEYQDQIKTDSYQNVIFPNYVLNEIKAMGINYRFVNLCGFTKRLKTPLFKDSEGNLRKKPLKNIQVGSKGFEILKPKGEIKNFIITESILDSLSLLDLKKLDPHHTLLCSTSGNFDIKKAEKLLKYFVDLKILSHESNIFLAFDNDENGREFYKKVEKYFQELNITPKLYIPFTKDCNDDLRLSKIISNIPTAQSLQDFLEKSLKDYQESKTRRNIILQKIRQIDKYKPLKESFKEQFNNIEKHKAIKKL
ncbi:toprim domain-containing protein [Helicobacter anatolicus]|uniref:toprim domain-containing protein n=1 Tax=Helicobacter anatolicus TaxID=2905874 RepID=UPI001E2D4498|nr:toprim domain-containing protein [Helicobacter anatolicus]MCE3037697.1 toprim domain-containing protein [Helicobacter anatolicus]